MGEIVCICACECIRVEPQTDKFKFYVKPTPHHLPHPIVTRLLPMISVLCSTAIQTEYVHRLRIRAGHQVLSTCAKRERYN